MRVVVTGSSGHLGEGLARTLRARGDDVVGIDARAGGHTDVVGSICEREILRAALAGADAVVHAATLHKPHIETHSRREFVETNVLGTLDLLEASVAAKVRSFVFTSTTSVFGHASRPPPGAPAAWLTESVPPEPRNIYGVTKLAAENLCELFHRLESLPCIVLRTSRFFPEEDDRREVRRAYADENAKANEYLYRRVDLADAVAAHLCAIERADDLGFGRYIVSATTPFAESDGRDLRDDPTEVVSRLHPTFSEVYARLGWRMFPGIDRVYVNRKAREELGWRPQVDFASILARVSAGDGIWSPLARQVGAKGYHDEEFADGPYPVAE